jgi:Zn-dependent oligopeptidase
MDHTRRAALLSLLASPLTADAQAPYDRQLPVRRDPDEEARLPNGKSQKDAIAKQNHEEALKDAQSLVSTAQQLQDELKKAGSYVVPVESVEKTKEIEKLARRIRGRLKG